MDFLLISTAVLAVIIAGLSKGGFGASAAFAATPVLAIAVGPVAAAAILLPILIVMDWFGVRSYWRQWHWPVVWPMMLACVPGVVIGWLLFSRLSIAWLSILLGGLTLVLFGYRLLDALRHRRLRAAQPNALGATWWGSLAGFTSFLIHAGGPPVAVYLLPLQLSKRVYQATTVLFFAFVNAIKLVPYFALGLFDTSNLAISLWLLPLAPVAMLLGIWAHDKINEKLFYRVVYTLAVLASLKLLWDGVVALI